MISYRSDSITVFQSALFQTTSTVIEGDGFMLVVDPTWLPHEVEAIAEHVRTVRAGRPLFLLFTHSDFDHILGLGAFPDAAVIASEAFRHNPDQGRSVQKVRDWDSDYYILRPYTVRYPTVDIVATHDGQQLSLGGAVLTFYSAPGHSPEGLFTVVEPHGILLAGDYLSDIELPYLKQSSALYEATLRKLDGILERHAVGILVPGHGRVATCLPEMRERQQAGLRYLQAMRRYIAAGDQSALDTLLQQSPFPQGMKAFHEDNRKLMQAEQENHA